MKPKWKPHDDPQCGCQGCAPPSTTIEFPNGHTWVWHYDLSAGDVASIIGAIELTTSSSLKYQQTVTGWNTKYVVLSDRDPGDEDPNR